MKNISLLVFFFLLVVISYSQTYRKLKLSEVESIEIWILSFAKHSKVPIAANDLLDFHDSYSEFYPKDRRFRRVIRHYNHLKLSSNEEKRINARVLCRIKPKSGEPIDMVINHHPNINIHGQTYKFDKKLCNFLLDELNPLTPVGGWD